MRSDKIFFELIIVIQGTLGSIFLGVFRFILCVHPECPFLGGSASFLYNQTRGIFLVPVVSVSDWRTVDVIFDGLASLFFCQPVSFFSDILASVSYR